MDEQCKHCFKKATTTYNRNGVDEKVCSRHWKLFSEADEAKAAKDVIHMGPLPINLEGLDKEDK